MNTEPDRITRIMACGVFRSALKHLRLTRRYPNVRLTYLPAVLHTRPPKLEKYLLRKVALAEEKGERIICLYGDCFPEINEFCQLHGIVKIPGANCYEMLLGTERFKQLMDETAGTYFLEKELLLNFNDYCIKPLELYDEEMRKYCFEHYQKLLYVRQPTDPNLISKAADLAEFLELTLTIRDADYSHLESSLIEVV